MNKILWFEGAGMHDDQRWNDVFNCRLRTAFHNIAGDAIYLELLAGVPHKEWSKGKYANTPYGVASQWPWYAIVDFAYLITDDPNIDDCNECRFDCERELYNPFSWELKEILRFVNHEFGCDFYEVRVSDEMEAYAVHKGSHTRTAKDYRFGDEYLPNRYQTLLARVIREHFNSIEREAGFRYPNFSCWIDPDITNLLYLRNHHGDGVVYPSPIDLSVREDVLAALSYKR